MVTDVALCASAAARDLRGPHRNPVRTARGADGAGWCAVCSGDIGFFPFHVLFTGHPDRVHR